MTEYVKAWQCIGCGRIEAPQTCIDVCQHRKVHFVYAAEHEAALGSLRAELADLQALARRLACTTPHDDGFKASYLALQRSAREILSRREGTPAPRGFAACPRPDAVPAERDH